MSSVSRRAVWLAGCTVAALASFAMGLPSASPTQQDSFAGWVVYQDGSERRFASTDRWTASPLGENFTFKRGSDYVTYYGTFRVEQWRGSKPAKPMPRGGDQAWTVQQGSFSKVYPKRDRWTLTHNPRGIQIESKGRIDWYYGSLTIEYSEGSG